MDTLPPLEGRARRAVLRPAALIALGRAALGGCWRALDTLKGGSARTAWMVAAGAAIAGLCALVLFIGPSVIAAAPWDVYALLDGGWRVFNGQVPSTDFYTTVGPMIYWLISLGMHAGAPSLMACVYGGVIFLAVVGPLALIVFFRKFAPPLAFLLTLFVAMLALATHALGYAPDATSYTMIYNRYCWVLATILWAQLLLEDHAPHAKPGAFDALSAGVLLGLLFLFKITYVFLGAAALALALALRPELRRFAWRTAAGFAAVCLIGWATFGFNIAHYLGDVVFAGAAQSPSMRFETFKQVVKFNFLKGVVLGLAWAALVAWPVRQGRISLEDAWRTTLICGFIFASSLLVSVGNTSELGDLPHFLLAGAVMIEAWIRANGVPRLRESLAFHSGALIVVAVFFGGFLMRDGSSLAHSYSWRAYRDAAPATQYLNSPNYRDFVVLHTAAGDAAYSRVFNTPEQVNRGIALIRAHAAPNSRVVALATANPFSMALGLPPSRGAPLWWHEGATFSRDRAPPPESVFQEADFVIYPALFGVDRGCCEDTVRILLEVYGEYLRANFVEAGRSEDWVLLRRLTPD